MRSIAPRLPAAIKAGVEPAARFSDRTPPGGPGGGGALLDRIAAQIKPGLPVRPAPGAARSYWLRLDGRSGGRLRRPAQEDWIAKPRVLVVEDDPLVLMSAAEALRDAGLRVAEAETADAALAMLQAADGGVDLVFTDVETPGELDGLALARRIRQQWPALPVIVTSGRVRPEPAALPDTAHFLGKPYDLDQVSALIARLATA